MKRLAMVIALVAVPFFMACNNTAELSPNASEGDLDHAVATLSARCGE